MTELFQLQPQATAAARGTCKTCKYHKAYDVHYSGPPKIVHYCMLNKAGKSGRAGVTRLKWSCLCWKGKPKEATAKGTDQL